MDPARIDPLAPPPKEHVPGEGGWIPTPMQRFWVCVGSGGAGSLALILPSLIAGPWGLALAAVVGGSAAAAAAFFGTGSAGPRNLTPKE